MRRLIFSAAVFMLLALVGSATRADTASSPVERPGIGLVLAGGGARGLAHIGVIGYLEEQRIKVDAVAWTNRPSFPLTCRYTLGQASSPATSGSNLTT